MLVMPKACRQFAAISDGTRPVSCGGKLRRIAMDAPAETDDSADGMGVLSIRTRAARRLL